MANPPRITDADIAVYGGIRVLALMRASTISLAQVTVQSAISIAMANA